MLSPGPYLFFIFFGLVILLLVLMFEVKSVSRTIAQEQSVRAICDANTAKGPELALLDDDRYHLFLSRASRTTRNRAHAEDLCHRKRVTPTRPRCVTQMSGRPGRVPLRRLEPTRRLPLIRFTEASVFGGRRRRDDQTVSNGNQTAAAAAAAWCADIPCKSRGARTRDFGFPDIDLRVPAVQTGRG